MAQRLATLQEQEACPIRRLLQLRSSLILSLIATRITTSRARKLNFIRMFHWCNLWLLEYAGEEPREEI
jgi:hypothetical protein